MSARFVVREISGYRIGVNPTGDRSSGQKLTTEVAVFDSWYGYAVVANYPSPLSYKQRLDERRTLAREQCERLNRRFSDS